MNSSEKNIFKSTKHSIPSQIFEVSKVKKPRITDQSCFSDDFCHDNQSTMSTVSSPKTSIDLSEVAIPSFFNDISFVPDIEDKLRQYDKVFSEFEDNEDREIYLVRKESLFSN